MRGKSNFGNLIVYIAICLALGWYAKATTYLECTSKDINTCKKEVTKGDVIVGKLTDSKKMYVKIDFVTVDPKKATVKIDND
jgi:hypothetical protein